MRQERDIIHDLITKSEDDFEKKITYISAGALLLSVTLLEKVLSLGSALYLWILILGWVSLTLTLLLNLFSHLISKVFMRKNIDEIDEQIDYQIRRNKHKNRVFCIEALNWTTAILLFIGISSLVLFTSLNAAFP